MARLDKKRQENLEPKRLTKAINEIENLGYVIEAKCENHIQFLYKGCTVTYFPYSGWASGRSINDGRGLKNLLKQLENKNA
ncbi:hypothetical protein [Aquimarina intermedia]|uniref:Uncharacterized protein n=1 Tax=Aquimarina intermedia TaxID=350814 RepID=A0A5S5BYU2_9FLAO|nr:hypothetical protein [Aquimarina intermedia]TYP71518.1 hypothetical protein BD809_109100 [Aquimarina intermedia]